MYPFIHTPWHDLNHVLKIKTLPCNQRPLSQTGIEPAPQVTKKPKLKHVIQTPHLKVQETHSAFVFLFIYIKK